MSGVWRVEFERPERWWRYYHCVAVASESGDEFRLECRWERPVYYLGVTSTACGPDHPLFERLLFADADCGKYVRQVMRIARHDVARRLVRLDSLHRDAMLGGSTLNCGPTPTGNSTDVDR